MKKCTICQSEKPKSEFNVKKRSKDGLQNICKPCSQARSRRYYQENKQKHLAVISVNTKKYKSRVRAYLRQVKILNGCALCDETEPCCMDFHHLKDKNFLLSRYIKTATPVIQKELDKCVCLCSNCHRKVHHGLAEVNEDHKCQYPPNADES